MLWNKSNNNWMEEMLDIQLHKSLLTFIDLFMLFFANFFTWLSKNKPICWCTNWNSPFILGDISLLKIAKFLYSLGIEAAKKTCIVPCFYCRPGHAFIMYAKWDPRPTCPSSRPVTFLIQVQKSNKKMEFFFVINVTI